MNQEKKQFYTISDDYMHYDDKHPSDKAHNDKPHSNNSSNCCHLLGNILCSYIDCLMLYVAI